MSVRASQYADLTHDEIKQQLATFPRGSAPHRLAHQARDEWRSKLEGTMREGRDEWASLMRILRWFPTTYTATSEALFTYDFVSVLPDVKLSAAEARKVKMPTVGGRPLRRTKTKGTYQAFTTISPVGVAAFPRVNSVPIQGWPRLRQIFEAPYDWELAARNIIGLFQPEGRPQRRVSREFSPPDTSKALLRGADGEINLVEGVKTVQLELAAMMSAAQTFSGVWNTYCRGALLRGYTSEQRTENRNKLRQAYERLFAEAWGDTARPNTAVVRFLDAYSRVSEKLGPPSWVDTAIPFTPSERARQSRRATLIYL